MNRKPRIFLSPPHVGELEKLLVNETFQSNWIAPLGPQVDAFECEIAERAGTKYAVALSSGTAALHLLMRWLKLGPGDEVICSALTFSASVNPVLYERATPVFIDSEKESWNMDPKYLEFAIKDRRRRGKNVKAVILVHLYGQSANISPILEICHNYGIPLIEDAAEALGAKYKNSPPGSFGLGGVHSFNGNKIITTSGGGALVTDNESLAKKARFWASQSRDPAPHYQHSELGFNYRLSNLLAAIGRGQLSQLDARISARRANFLRYSRALDDLPGIEFMPEPSYGVATRWLTCLTVDSARAGVSREDVRLALEAENIESRPVWKPMHLQPLFSGCAYYGEAVAEDLFDRGLCLPSGSNLSEDEANRVIEVVKRVWRAP